MLFRRLKHFSKIFLHFFLGGGNVFFNTHTMHIKSTIHNSIAVFFLKKLAPWRDSNPGLLFRRCTGCPLRHAASKVFSPSPMYNPFVSNQPFSYTTLLAEDMAVSCPEQLVLVTDIIHC
jgi:hypothetical protein